MFEASAVDRWHGVRSFTSSADKSSGLVWWVLIILALALSAVVVIVAVWKYGQMRRKAAGFRSAGDQAGLRTEEMKLLMHIAKLSGVKNIAVIFNADVAFNRGVESLMHSAKVAAMSEAMCANLNTMLGSLREKLGFEQIIDDGTKAISSSRQITTGSRVFITLPGSDGPVEATIVSTRPSDFLVEADEPLVGHFGQVFGVRCPVGSTAWEFDATVIRSDIDGITLRHSSDIRIINLRRFPRIATNKPAQVAMFPFSDDTPDLQSPHFVPAVVVEIGGSGLLIEMPMQAHIDEKTIVVVKIDKRRQVQGVGKVRRTFTDETGNEMVAIELVGLNSDELAELVSETNIAANQRKVEVAETSEASAWLPGEKGHK
jgi:hypothetical protein